MLKATNLQQKPTSYVKKTPLASAFANDCTLNDPEQFINL